MNVNKKIIGVLLCGLFALAGMEIHGAKMSDAQQYGESLQASWGRPRNKTLSKVSQFAVPVSSQKIDHSQAPVQNKSSLSLRGVAFVEKVILRAGMDVVCDRLEHAYAASRLGQQIDNWVSEYATYNVRSDVNTNDNKLYRFIKDTGNAAAPFVDKAAPYVKTAIRMGADASIRAAVLKYNDKLLGTKGSSFKRFAVVEFCGNLARKALPFADQRLEGCTFRGSQQLRVGLAWLANGDSQMSNLVWHSIKQAALEYQC